MCRYVYVYIAESFDVCVLFKMLSMRFLLFFLVLSSLLTFFPVITSLLYFLCASFSVLCVSCFFFIKFFFFTFSCYLFLVACCMYILFCFIENFFNFVKWKTQHQDENEIKKNCSLNVLCVNNGIYEKKLFFGPRAASAIFHTNRTSKLRTVTVCPVLTL